LRDWDKPQFNAAGGRREEVDAPAGRKAETLQPLAFEADLAAARRAKGVIEGFNGEFSVHTK
jgi:hypothetical protein